MAVLVVWSFLTKEKLKILKKMLKVDTFDFRRRRIEDAVGVGGGGEPRAGDGGHELLAHPPRVPSLPRSYHPSHQTVHQGETQRYETE